MNAETELRQAGRLAVFDAVGWNSAAVCVSYAFSFLRTVILARLLAPSDFGLVGLAGSITGAWAVFTDFNFRTRIITKPLATENERRTYLNTAWTADLVRSGLLTLLTCAAAWPAARYFGDDRVFGVLLIVSLCPLISGFQNVGLVQFEKDLTFKRLVLQRQGAQLAGFGAVIVIACFTRNYVALVTGQLCDSILQVGLSYRLCAYRPSLAIDREALKDCLGFGKSLFVVGLLTFVTTQFDNLVVARALGAAALGSYLVAYRLASLPVELLGRVLNSVLLPAYSNIQIQSPEKLCVAFRRANGVGAVGLLAVVGSMALVPHELVQLLYGGKWMAAGPLLAVLVLVGLFRGLAWTVTPLLMAVERPDLDAKCKIVEVSLFIPSVILAVGRYGAVGAAWAGVASYGVAYLLRAVAAVHVFPEYRRSLLLSMGTPLGCASVAWAAAAAARASAPTLLAVAAYLGLLVGLVCLTDLGFRAALRAATVWGYAHGRLGARWLAGI